jgi:hypothetical protein
MAIAMAAQRGSVMAVAGTVAMVEKLRGQATINNMRQQLWQRQWLWQRQLWQHGFNSRQGWQRDRSGDDEGSGNINNSDGEFIPP